VQKQTKETKTMKKLIIAVAAVAMGIAANAASFTWKAQNGYIWDGADTPAKITSGTAYLMFTSIMTQSDLVDAFAADAATAASTVATKTVNAATIGSNARVALTDSFTVDVTSDQTAYFVVFNGDKMYVSVEASAPYMAVGDSDIGFSSVTASSKLSFDVAGGYSAAGWYGAAAVPEPTSGLLMLLGMAGLALRRRRA
jgi:hypothetical protein